MASLIQPPPSLNLQHSTRVEAVSTIATLQMQTVLQQFSKMGAASSAVYQIDRLWKKAKGGTGSADSSLCRRFAMIIVHLQ